MWKLKKNAATRLMVAKQPVFAAFTTYRKNNNNNSNSIL